MGNFSYTCHLSGLPITGGTKAVLLPLFPKSHWSYDNSQLELSKYGKGNLCSNDGANMFFDELFFPIYGEYDSYGRLENIEHDDNTKVLEEFFGLTIEQIATVIACGRRDEYEKGSKYCDATGILDKTNEKHMMLLKTSATWYHRGFYEKLTKVESKDYFDRLDLGTHGILVALGFNYIGIDKSQERYKKVYEKDSLKIHSDGTWINIPKEHIYGLTELKKYCAKKGVEIDSTTIKGGHYSQIYDFILPYVKSINEFTADRHLVHMLLGDEHKINTHKFELYEMLLSEGLGTEDYKEKIKKENSDLIDKNITLFYFTKIKENGGNFLKKNIEDWFNVKKYYYSTGRYLYPVGTAAQDGDHKNVQSMLQAALEALNEDMKNFDDDYEDDEEND